MKRVNERNINTALYWDGVYKAEAPSAKQRVDDERFAQLLRWYKIREEELNRPPTMLDAGCGLGEVSHRIRPHAKGAELWGVDISPDAIQMNVRRQDPSERHMHWESGSVEKLPFGNERFDIVWCGETLEHLDDPVKGVQELVRVTGKGGLTVISVPYQHRNSGEEHVWEFETADVAQFGAMAGQLVYLDARILPGWLSIFAVLRKAIDP